jgi:hypothetical protein
MRAVHEDPPCKPLIPGFYHLQNDELLGSWLILLANVPVVPYSLIYLAKDRTNWVYMGALLVSVILVIGSTLFVQACYPSTKVRCRAVRCQCTPICVLRLNSRLYTEVLVLSVAYCAGNAVLCA